jgi:hypothetical protein
MDLISAAEILTFSRPFFDPLLDGSKDKLKEVGKDLTGKTLDALHAFWQRLTRASARKLPCSPAAQKPMKT